MFIFNHHLPWPSDDDVHCSLVTLDQTENIIWRCWSMAEFSQARIVNENRVFMCWSGREKQEQTKQKKNNRVPQARKLLTRMSWKYLWGSKSELYQQGFNSCYILFWPDKALVWKQYVFFNIVIFSLKNLNLIVGEFNIQYIKG